MPDIRPVGEHFGQHADELGHAPAELVKFGSFICGQRAVSLHEKLAQLRKSGKGVCIVQEDLQARLPVSTLLAEDTGSIGPSHARSNC